MKSSSTHQFYTRFESTNLHKILLEVMAGFVLNICYVVLLDQNPHASIFTFG